MQAVRAVKGGDVLPSAGDERRLETCFNRGIGRCIHETLGYDVIMAIYADEYRFAGQVKSESARAVYRHNVRRDAEYILRS